MNRLTNDENKVKIKGFNPMIKKNSLKTKAAAWDYKYPTAWPLLRQDSKREA